MTRACVFVRGVSGVEFPEIGIFECRTIDEYIDGVQKACGLTLEDRVAITTPNDCEAVFWGDPLDPRPTYVTGFRYKSRMEIAEVRQIDPDNLPPNIIHGDPLAVRAYLATMRGVRFPNPKKRS